jgi:hypothetical protein
MRLVATFDSHPEWGSSCAKQSKDAVGIFTRQIW